MRRLSFLIVSMAISLCAVSQKSPHGDAFAINCTECHNTDSWKVDFKAISFNHNNTNFQLQGQHQALTCRLCHKSLEFSKTGKECISCHTDMHNQTVGPDCGRCHTPNSWIVSNITEIHQRSRFPLVGPHVTADCYDCHINASPSLLSFSTLGVECYDCHQSDYASTTNPNHQQAGYSTNCTDCHSMTSFDWGPNVDHAFFPLTLGHAVDCRQCHTSGSFSKLPTSCASCHQDNYNASTNPNHVTLQFPTICDQCHTTDPGWRPANYDHGTFLLTLGHSNVDCNSCHNNNYVNTSRVCSKCHQSNYDATTNPNHVLLQFPTVCDQCHTTNPGWKPATFDHTAFPLTLGHSNVECNKCHVNGNYTNTPKDCYACHQANYAATTNPSHVTLALSTNCTECHTTNPGWKPAQFPNHDPLFPIYSGKHNSPVWNQCSDCHINPSNYGIFTCIDCHPHNNKAETDDQHKEVGGYAYNSPACYACHPTGEAEGGFNHNAVFPLTGAHTSTPCNECHVTGYQNTPNVCSECHSSAYNQSANPNHTAINIPNTCETCHTTNPDWKPATFPIHNNYYVLAGAHAAIAGNCASCHNGNYNSTPNTCVGCHLNDYNQATDPNHAAAQFPTTCQDCHSQNAWIPANWNHDGLYFPIYSGKHRGEWNTCSDCHKNPSNYTEFTCTTSCHPQGETNSEHQGVAGYSYNSTACYNCHPNGTAPKMMQQDINKY